MGGSIVSSRVEWTAAVISEGVVCVCAQITAGGATELVTV